jgi:hypothetical protein
MKGVEAQVRDVSLENDVNLHRAKDPLIACEYARLDYGFAKADGNGARDGSGGGG